MRITLLALVVWVAALTGCTARIVTMPDGRGMVQERRPGATRYDTLTIYHFWEKFPAVDIKIRIYGSFIDYYTLSGYGAELPLMLPVGKEFPIWFMYYDPAKGKYFHGKYLYPVPDPDTMEVHAIYLDDEFMRRFVKVRGKWKYGF